MRMEGPRKNLERFRVWKVSETKRSGSPREDQEGTEEDQVESSRCEEE